MKRFAGLFVPALVKRREEHPVTISSGERPRYEYELACATLARLTIATY
jgi:hypothetical protein